MILAYKTDLIIGIIFSCLLTHMLISCKQQDALPEIEISKRCFIFENIKQGEMCTDSFYVENKGSKPLVINKISGDCSCLNVKMTDRVVEPGCKSIVFFCLDTSEKYETEKNFILMEANTDSILHYVTVVSQTIE